MIIDLPVTRASFIYDAPDRSVHGTGVRLHHCDNDIINCFDGHCPMRADYNAAHMSSRLLEIPATPYWNMPCVSAEPC